MGGLPWGGVVSGPPRFLEMVDTSLVGALTLFLPVWGGLMVGNPVLSLVVSPYMVVMVVQSLPSCVDPLLLCVPCVPFLPLAKTPPSLRGT